MRTALTAAHRRVDPTLATETIFGGFGGGPPASRRPAPAVANGMLAMVVFLATETMLFAGLISAFLVLRAGTAAWPPPGQPRLPIAVTGINTAVLFVSAYTMHGAVRARHGGRLADVRRLLAITAALGTTFLVVQGLEWTALLRHGLTTSSSLYGATFYALIGCHGLHVLAAVVALIVVFGWSLGRDAAADGQRLEVCRVYWWFVVAVWPVLYVLVYLT